MNHWFVFGSIGLIILIIVFGWFILRLQGYVVGGRIK